MGAKIAEPRLFGSHLDGWINGWLNDVATAPRTFESFALLSYSLGRILRCINNYRMRHFGSLSMDQKSKVEALLTTARMLYLRNGVELASNSPVEMFQFLTV